MLALLLCLDLSVLHGSVGARLWAEDLHSPATMFNWNRLEIGIFRSIRPLIEFYTIFFIVLILMFRIDNSIRCGEHNNV